MEASGPLHAVAALAPGKIITVPTECEAEWASGRSGRIGVDTDVLPVTGIEPRFLGCPARSLVTIPKDLSGLHLNFHIE
jgi:hypothetical protein